MSDLARLVADALEHVYGGDQSVEAEALLDQLRDRGVVFYRATARCDLPVQP